MKVPYNPNKLSDNLKAASAVYGIATIAPIAVPLAIAASAVALTIAINPVTWLGVLAYKTFKTKNQKTS